MTMTPLEEIEARLHAHYGDEVPTKEAAADFLATQYPRMDGGLAIAIALAALALQGWQVYRDERDRSVARGGVNRCPECGRPPLSKDADGNFVCKNGHCW